MIEDEDDGDIFVTFGKDGVLREATPENVAAVSRSRSSSGYAKAVESAKCTICKGRGKISRLVQGKYRTRRCPICCGTSKVELPTPSHTVGDDRFSPAQPSVNEET